jgi:3-deoxy-D-manno-octulosonic-acid transferase
MTILTEGELWPNLLRQCRARGIPAIVINGRMSERSARGYRLLGPLTRAALGCLDGIYVQSEGDRRRYVARGADPARVEVLGSVKYDLEADLGAAARVMDVVSRTGWGPGTLILLGGSTWPGEEGALGETFQRLRASHPDLRLVLVPRHAERAQAVAEELDRLGLRVLRRSMLGPSPSIPPPDVLLVDTTGELKSFYAAAHVVFVGKSMFDNRGGQNFIEPAFYGKPVLTGPHLENFPAVAEDFLEAGALIQVADVDALARQTDRLLGDLPEREAMGRRAADLVARRRGVMTTTVSCLRARLGALS